MRARCRLVGVIVGTAIGESRVCGGEAAALVPELLRHEVAAMHARRAVLRADSVLRFHRAPKSEILDHGIRTETSHGTLR